MTRRRDPDSYGRRPTSRSRGRTQDHIMRLQHDPERLPGAEQVLEGAPDGSIADAVGRFHQAWVVDRPVTARRSYERSLAMLLRDLDAAATPSPHAPARELALERLQEHLRWRVGHGLVDRGELQRAAVHLERLAAWCDEHAGTAIGDSREPLRATVADLLAGQPATYHDAASSDELRDTAGDAAALGLDPDEA